MSDTVEPKRPDRDPTLAPVHAVSRVAGYLALLVVPIAAYRIDRALQRWWRANGVLAIMDAVADRVRTTYQRDREIVADTSELIGATGQLGFGIFKAIRRRVQR